MRQLITSPGKAPEKRRIHKTAIGFIYHDLNAVNHAVQWSDIRNIVWREPLYGPLGSVPCWCICTSVGELEIDEWWDGSEKLKELFIQNLPGFTLPPNAHEYTTQPPEGHLCWSAKK